MIYTVTLNPTLDKTLSVPVLRPGEVHRASFLRRDVGGKGINVSRALAALGIASRPIGFLGGATGRAMAAGLAAEGFDGRFVQVPGETRQNLTLLDESTGLYTKINEPGATAGPVQIAKLRRLVAGLAAAGDLWAFCGSLPPAAPPDLYAALIAQVQAAGALAFLDTSGPALQHGLAAGPHAIKPNSEEAAQLLGMPVTSTADHIAAIRRLAGGAVSGDRPTAIPAPHIVCLTRGAQGLLLAVNGHIVAAEPPRVAARSPVGAGDAALAGLLWAVSEHCDPEEMARRAVACGAAAAMQEGTGVGTREQVAELLSRVSVRPL